MSLPHRLRRYLRAHLGNTALADETMLDALERMVAGRQEITAIAAFRAAHRVATRMTPAPAAAEPMQQALAALPGGSRAAFLLLRLERFTAAEAAEIMDISAERVAEEAQGAAMAIRHMLVPTGGTALITDPDQLTAMDLANIATDVGFNAIREPDLTARTPHGHPAPVLIIAEAVDRDGRATAGRIATMAGTLDAAVLCVTASTLAGEFLRQVPGAVLLHKPFETATAIRTILDLVAEHRFSRIRTRIDGEA